MGEKQISSPLLDMESGEACGTYLKTRTKPWPDCQRAVRTVMGEGGRVARRTLMYPSFKAVNCSAPAVSRISSCAGRDKICIRRLNVAREDRRAEDLRGSVRHQGRGRDDRSLWKTR